jgi:hypothetical protein
MSGINKNKATRRLHTFSLNCYSGFICYWDFYYLEHDWKVKKKIPVLYAYLSVKTLLLRGIEVWFSSLKC